MSEGDTVTVQLHEGQTTVRMVSSFVLISSWQTGHLALSPFLWSNRTMFPQCGHLREIILSVFTSITYPQSQGMARWL